MGFSSWECKGCSRSIRNAFSPSGLEDWMEKAVVLFKDDSVLKGKYDGYGCLEGPSHSEIDLSDSGDEGGWWHEACWEHAGRPPYDSPSKHARDQGHFVGPEITWWPPGKTECRMAEDAAYHAGMLLTTKREAYLRDVLQLLEAVKVGLVELEAYDSVDAGYASFTFEQVLKDIATEVREYRGQYEQRQRQHDEKRMKELL